MRVLAVTADASLLVALNSMLRGWEVRIVGDADDAVAAAPGSAILLVDFGSTERGLDVAEQIWSRGVTVPCVVIGDEEAPNARPRILVRPFELDDLIGTVVELAAEAGVVAGLPRAARVGADGPSAAEAAVEPGAPRPQGAEAVSSPSPAPAPAPAPESPAASEPPRPPAARRASAAAAREARTAKPKARVRTASSWPPATTEPPPAVVPPETVAPKQVIAPPRRPRQAERGRGLFRRNVVPKDSDQLDPFAKRIRAALSGLQEAEALIEELPPLARPRSMAHAFLAEVVASFAPETAVVYLLGNDGTYHAAAAHGLSAVEAGMRVPPDQQLFLEVTTGLEAVLIAPVDLAQGLVAGIGGARTEALAAAPVVVERTCHGVIVLGRRTFTEADLDVLADLANEAGPGLALAQAVEKLTAR